MTIWHCAAVGSVLVLVSGFASGQTDGRPVINAVRISGRTMDQTGAPIANATVSLKAVFGETTAVTHTHDDGTFAFPNAQPKKYELSVEMAGFKRTVRMIDAASDQEFKAGDIVMPVGDPPIIDEIRADTVPLEVPLIVEGLGGTSAMFYVSDFSKLPQQIIKTIDHGTHVTFQGVLLADALSHQVGLPTGEAFHSTAASYYVIAEALDGYKSVFAWAEIDPTFTDRKVYVVTKRDGRPLSSHDGPFELIVPGENGAARWVRQVTALKIKRAN